MSIKPQLLLIEDNSNIAETLVSALSHTYRVEHVATGRLGIYRSDTDQYQAVLLDLNLPDVDGLAVCQQLRERGVTCPIVVLTGNAHIQAKIKLLDAGANDYLVKPFSLGELKARLRVLLRPVHNSLRRPSSKLVISDLVLDPAKHNLTRQGRRIGLRRKEFALLECLMLHAGTVVTRDMLCRYAWHGDEAPWTNTVDVHIKYLRDKIDRPFDQAIIRTVHGIGYRLEAPVPVTAGHPAVDPE